MRMTRRRWWSAAALHWDDVSEYKKDRLETSGLFVLRVCGRAFLFILVETRVGHRVSKGVFRACGLDQVPPGRAQGTRPLRIPFSHTRFIRARRENEDSGLRAAGGSQYGAMVFYTTFLLPR